ncbi:MAG: sugar nucleotide-binding protein [Candidatus Komeilibacteria bacterium]
MILLLGGSGYVGSAFQKFFRQNNHAYINISRAERDYTHPEILRTIITELKPDFLINCAGYTGKPNVDACELHKTETIEGNVVLPGNIMKVCNELNLPWGHVSSGCIYTGNSPDGLGFRETDAPNFDYRHNNCSFYSGSKALAEEILSEAENCYLWRLRVPFNNEATPRNYLTKLMKYEKLLDATNSLSQLDEFVAAAHACWQERIPCGIYNMTNPGFVTAREVVAMISKAGLTDKKFSFFESEEEFMKTAAKTPRSSCVLNCDKREAAGAHMTEVHKAIEIALKDWETNK